LGTDIHNLEFQVVCCFFCLFLWSLI
jgi:hypothetical protein